MGNRRLKELNISACSYQSVADRYPPKGVVKAPPLVLYRNNLTALSHCRNLLFIACNDKIYIYKPQFPTQKIPSKPELIIDIPKSRRGLRGHIDPNKPHAVNQLAVGDLGNEEIVVVVCDNGDVVVYSTRSIYNVIEQDVPPIGANLKPTVEIKTLLLKNVGMSAWGVAIHKAARLIAVSSNLHQISVFAFALGRDQSPDSPCDLEEDDSLATDCLGPNDGFWVRVDESSCSPLQRSSKNIELILKGHEANIPNIAFCNTKADPIGRYLTSTDISGSTFVWDVWQRRIIADLSSHQRITKPVCGWGVACLDQQTYRLANSVKETFGCDSIGSYGEMEDTVCTPCVTYDNTASSYSVANSSQSHPTFAKYHMPASAAINSSAVINSSAELLTDLDDEGSAENEDYFDPDGIEDEDEDMEAEMDEDMEVQVYESGDDEASEMPFDTMQNFPAPSWSTPTVQDDSALSVSTPFQDKKPIQRIKISSLPFDIFTTSEFDLRFLFNVQIQGDDKRPVSYHSVVCKQALRQEIPPMLRYITHFERLNMLIPIPEIGVMAIANQLGRVALLTMTKSATTKDQHGFRLEWILPFRSEELLERRSELPLVGMAVGPVQCRETMPDASLGADDDDASVRFCGADAQRRVKPAAARRYRLFLFYYDHSILSYEFWRETFEQRFEGVREEGELIF